MRDSLYDKRYDFQNCWYRDICEKFETDKCSEHCRRFTQTDYLFQLSELPKCWWKPIKLSTDELEPNVVEMFKSILANVELFVLSGCSLYLYGDTGCGKTSWAVKIMNRYFAEIAERNGFENRGLYISVPSFLRDARLKMTYKDPNYMELLETIKKCDIVIWDELGQTDLTNYESQWLYSFINERLFARKCNIFTSNLSPEEMRTADKRLESRACRNSDCLHITGTDRRVNNTFSAFLERQGVVLNGTDSNTEQGAKV